MNMKTKNMVGVALFTAIVVVLQFLGGGIKVGGMFSISLVLVPIVVGKNNRFAVYTAAILCPVCNTGIFLLGCQFFFLETIAEWGKALGFEDVYAYMFLGLAGINFVIEVVVNIVLAPVIVRLIKAAKA